MGGKDRDRAKREALQALGRALARRARSRCELCEGGDALSPVLMERQAEPSLEETLLLCARCASALRGGRVDDPDALRFLEAAIWSDAPLVQAAAVKMAQRVDRPWAREALEALWLDDATRERLERLDPW